MSGDELQHTLAVLGAAMAIAALGTLLLSLASRWIGNWTTVLAIITSLVFSYPTLEQTPLFGNFKTDILRRILIAAIPLALMLMALSFKKTTGWARLATVMVCPALMLWFVFANYPVDRNDLLLHRVMPVSLAILAGWLLIEPVSHRTPGISVPLIIGCTTGAAAFILQGTMNQQVGSISPIIPATAAGALGAALIANVLKKPLSFSRGPVLLWLALIGAMYAYVWIDTELPVNHLCYVAAIPLLAWICEIPVIHRLKPWKRELIRFALMATPMTIVIVQVYKEMQQSEI